MTETANTLHFVSLYFSGLFSSINFFIFSTLFSLVLGHFIAAASLSANSILNKFANGYIKLFRETPLLVQILIWYLALIQILPNAWESITFIFSNIYLNNNGLYYATPVTQPGFWVVVLAFLATVLGAWHIRNHAEKKDQHSMQLWWLLFLMLVSVTAAFSMMMGRPLDFSPPALQEFSIKGGSRIPIEYLSFLISLVTFSAAHIAHLLNAGLVLHNPHLNEIKTHWRSKPHLMKFLLIFHHARNIMDEEFVHLITNLLKKSAMIAAFAYPQFKLLLIGAEAHRTETAQTMMLLTIAVYLTIQGGIYLYGHLHLSTKKIIKYLKSI